MRCGSGDWLWALPATCRAESAGKSFDGGFASALLLLCSCFAPALLLHCSCIAPALLLHCSCFAPALLCSCSAWLCLAVPSPACGRRCPEGADEGAFGSLLVRYPMQQKAEQNCTVLRTAPSPQPLSRLREKGFKQKHKQRPQAKASSKSLKPKPQAKASSKGLKQPRFALLLEQQRQHTRP